MSHGYQEIDREYDPLPWRRYGCVKEQMFYTRLLLFDTLQRVILPIPRDSRIFDFGDLGPDRDVSRAPGVDRKTQPWQALPAGFLRWAAILTIAGLLIVSQSHGLHLPKSGQYLDEPGFLLPVFAPNVALLD